MSAVAIEGSNTNLDLRVWGLVVIYFSVAATLFLLTGFHVGSGTALGMAGLTGLGSVVSIAAVWRMPTSRIIRIVSAVHQQFVFGLGSAMLAYAAATTNRPLADSAMLAFDRALAYDWRTYVEFFVTHSFLSEMLTSAYDSLFWQSFVVTVAAGLARNRFLLQQFVTAHVMVLLIAIGLFAIWPVTTAWVHLGIDADTLRSLNLTDGGWPKQLLALRTGRVHEVTSSSNFAIIGFPSYHCAAGLINIWATWRSRWLRWPMIGVSAVMIAATPIDGGHYLADLFGAVVAVSVAIPASRALLTARSIVLTWPQVGGRRPRPAAA